VLGRVLFPIRAVSRAPGPLLSPRRGRGCARRHEHRPLRRAAAPLLRPGAVRRHHAPEADDGGRRRPLRRDDGRRWRLAGRLAPPAARRGGCSLGCVNDLPFVERTLSLLADEGVAAWIFGGWAEELLGLAEAGAHGDLDLLVAADDWRDVDRLLERLDEIPAKRFEHKRAFVLDGVMVELFLVCRDAAGLFTTFWGVRRPWPEDTLDGDGPLPIASAAAVAGCRIRHPRHPAAAVCG